MTVNLDNDIARAILKDINTFTEYEEHSLKYSNLGKNYSLDDSHGHFVFNVNGRRVAISRYSSFSTMSVDYNTLDVSHSLIELIFTKLKEEFEQREAAEDLAAKNALREKMGILKKDQLSPDEREEADVVQVNNSTVSFYNRLIKWIRNL